MKKLLTLIALLLSVTACGHMVATGYDKPEATVQEYQHDRYQCMKDSEWVHSYQGLYNELHTEKVVDCSQFASCMESKGYTVKFNGQFRPQNPTKCDPMSQFVPD